MIFGQLFASTIRNWLLKEPRFASASVYNLSITFIENGMSHKLHMSENMQQCTSCGELVPIEYVVCVWCGFDLTAEHIRRAGIKIGKRESFDRMKRMIKDPLRTAKEIALIPDLTGGKLILYALAVLMTLNMLVVFGKLDGADFNAVDSGISISIRTFSFLISFKFIVGIVFLLVQPIVLYTIFFLFWKFSTNIIFILTKSFGGYADKMKIRTAIGYSLLPVFLGWFVRFLLTILTGHVTIGSTVSYDTINIAITTITREGAGFVGFLFLNIGWIGTIILMVISIRQVAKLSIIEGVIVGGFPTTIMMIIVLYGTGFLT